MLLTQRRLCWRALARGHKVRHLSSEAAWHVQSRLAQAGSEIDHAHGSLSPPLHLSTTFERDADGGYERGYFYSRSDNPTRSLLERTVAGLEGGSDAVSFASGMASINAIFHALLEPGSHVVLANDVFHGTATLLSGSYARWGCTFERVDMSDTSAVQAAIDGGASLVWCETPSNPMCKLTNVHDIARRARAAGVPSVVDATWCTPALLQPLALGADLVMHSSTKYLGGHSDLLGGIVVGGENSAPLLAAIRSEQRNAGAVPSPFDCWLLLRGLRSLSARLNLHCSNALAVAKMLEEHSAVSAVHYPGLPSHPQHELAKAQMRSGYGGMLSFELHGGEEAAVAVAARTKLWRRATSLGGPESLIQHNASFEALWTTPTSPPGLLRLSVGLENVEDLLRDLQSALDEGVKEVFESSSLVLSILSIAHNTGSVSFCLRARR